MVEGHALFAERAGVQVRYGCEWLGTRPKEDGFVLETSDGEYRCRYAVFALGVTEPWKSPIPGIEHVPHYADVERDPSAYDGKDVVVIGKRNSAFELADGLEPWARQLVLLSPRPVNTSVVALSTVRVRYMQPLEHHQVGGGTFALDAAIDRIERDEDGFVFHAEGTTRPGAFTVRADAAIAATGFSAPLRDLPDLGVATVAQGRIPALTPFWESATVPGIFFAGNATQGAAGLKKHGVGGSSAAVHGHRYNARVLARRLAAKLGAPVQRHEIPGETLVDKVLTALTDSPELWAQKAYLAVGFDEDGTADVLPLSFFLDAECRERVGATIEMNAAGEVYPVVYVRENGDVREHVLPPHPLRAYRSSEEHRRELENLL
jgi:thioredoxin reductase